MFSPPYLEFKSFSSFLALFSSRFFSNVTTLCIKLVLRFWKLEGLLQIFFSFSKTVSNSDLSFKIFFLCAFSSAYNFSFQFFNFVFTHIDLFVLFLQFGKIGVSVIPYHLVLFTVADKSDALFTPTHSLEQTSCSKTNVFLHYGLYLELLINS